VHVTVFSNKLPTHIFIFVQQSFKIHYQKTQSLIYNFSKYFSYTCVHLPEFNVFEKTDHPLFGSRQMSQIHNFQRNSQRKITLTSDTYGVVFGGEIPIEYACTNMVANFSHLDRPVICKYKMTFVSLCFHIKPMLEILY
jgi:hypothetical protein